MDRQVFEQNLKFISIHNPSLCPKLKAFSGTKHYRIMETKSGLQIPAIIDKSGAAHPLHSTVDPEREAQRLLSSLEDEKNVLSAGFLVFLGLGAGFAVHVALQRADVFRVLIIDYDMEGVSELLSNFDFTEILSDPRLNILIDPSSMEIESLVLEQYMPAFCGGIRILPLRARTEQDSSRFNQAADTIKQAIEKISFDYSVQAHFGSRWLSNIIRNLKTAQTQINRELPAGITAKMIPEKEPIEAVICAAGPSLDEQIPSLAELKQKQKNIFIIAADTSLPALLCHGITPDAVVSIDCQHISYYHFIGTQCRNIPLFLDLSSPPLLAHLSEAPVFFSGGHPLARYISDFYGCFPPIDTSGGNVTYACLSVAESLGAEKIHIYGADFSYPHGRLYAKGAYIYRYFEKKQNRFSSLESQISSFLYRSDFLPSDNKRYYETATLRFYRNKFEEKASTINAEITAEPGAGAPIQLLPKKIHHLNKNRTALFADPFKPRTKINALDFLEQYKKAICNLPLIGQEPGIYMQKLKDNERRILATILPLLAAIKHRRPELGTSELFEATKKSCIEEIENKLIVNS